MDIYIYTYIYIYIYVYMYICIHIYIYRWSESLLHGFKIQNDDQLDVWSYVTTFSWQFCKYQKSSDDESTICPDSDQNEDDYHTAYDDEDYYQQGIPGCGDDDVEQFQML